MKTLAVGAGEESVEQAAKHRARVAREDVSQTLVFPGLLNQPAQGPLVLVDGGGRGFLGGVSAAWP